MKEPNLGCFKDFGKASLMLSALTNLTKLKEFRLQLKKYVFREESSRLIIFVNNIRLRSNLLSVYKCRDVAILMMFIKAYLTAMLGVIRLRTQCKGSLQHDLKPIVQMHLVYGARMSITVCNCYHLTYLHGHKTRTES